MAPDTRLDTLSSKNQSLGQEAASGEITKVDDRFTNLGVNLVVIVLTIVAFAPFFSDPNFASAPLLRRISLIGLGLLYLFNGTFGMIMLERHIEKSASSIIYFSLQIAITLALLMLSRGFNSGIWLLILPLAAQSLALYSWVMTLAISSVLMGGIWYAYFRDQPLSESILDLLSIGSSLVFTLIFTYIAVRESTTRVQIEELAVDLRQANHRLAKYAAQVEELATTKERNRLARDIHDNLGHYLTVINVQIEVARTLLTEQPDKAQDALEKAQKLTQDGLGAVRQSVRALRDSPLAQKTLVEAIQSLVDDSRASGIQTDLMVTGTERPLDPKIALTFYRIAQEGLTNIRKHARASTALLILDFARADRLTLTVEDDGVGAADTNGSGFGLIGTMERLQLLGGDLQIKTAPGTGFCLTAIIPTESTAAARD